MAESKKIDRRWSKNCGYCGEEDVRFLDLLTLIREGEMTLTCDGCGGTGRFVLSVTWKGPEPDETD